jgi:hypothetical protein
MAIEQAGYLCAYVTGNVDDGYSELLHSSRPLHSSDSPAEKDFIA